MKSPQARSWGVGLLTAVLVASLTIGVAPRPSDAQTPSVTTPASSPDVGIRAFEAASPRSPRKAARHARLQVGTQFHGTWTSYDDAERAAVLDRLAAMGARWVRLDISWAMLQPSGPDAYDLGWGVPYVDKVIAMAHRRGLKVLGMLWMTPAWANPSDGERSAPADPQTYARALAWAARRWQGEVQAWEIWNEPNSSDFFRSKSAADYTRLLCAAHRAVRADGKRAMTVFGGTVHNDVDWIRQAYDAGAKGCFDRMATHPYVGPSNQGPWGGGTDDAWDFNRLTAVRQLMVSRGDRKPIWATEFGWSSHPNAGGEAPWNTGVTEGQQARYTVAAIRLLRRDHPYVTKAFIYNEREKETSDPHQNGYGILRADMSPKPVYLALRQLLRG